METDFFRDLNLKTTWTVELFWTILKCSEFLLPRNGAQLELPGTHLPYLPMPSGPACDHLHLLSLASADWGGPGNMKQRQTKTTWSTCKSQNEYHDNEEHPRTKGNIVGTLLVSFGVLWSVLVSLLLDIGIDLHGLLSLLASPQYSNGFHNIVVA